MTYNPNFVGIPPLARSVAAQNAVNNTGSTIAQATPVKLTETGMALIDVSVEADIDAIAGVTKAAVTDPGQGEIVPGGIIENISTTFNVGDAVYISKTGELTNQKPTLGLNGFQSGDFMVRIGSIAKNTSNPLLKDLLVLIQIGGQL